MIETFYCIYCGRPFKVDTDTDDYNLFTYKKHRDRKVRNKPTLDRKVKDDTKFFVNHGFQRTRLFNRNRCAICNKIYPTDELHPIALFNADSHMFTILCDNCYEHYNHMDNLIDNLLYREICRLHGGKSYLTVTEYEEAIWQTPEDCHIL